MNDFVRELQSYGPIAVKMMKNKKEIKPVKVHFGRNRSQYFLHYSPIEKKFNEIVIYIHGGGWNSRRPDDFDFIGQKIASAGYECMIFGYRKVPGFHYNDMIEDICREYKAMLNHLKTQKIGASRVIVTGSSAGAHLGSILVYDREIHTRYKIGARRFVGFIGLAGPYCFKGELTWMLKQLLGDLFEKGQDWNEGEPYSRLDLIVPGEDCPEINIPMYLIHSDHDSVINMKQTVLFAKKAMELQIPMTLYRVTDKNNTHTSYSTAIFFDDESENKTLLNFFKYMNSLSTKVQNEDD